MLLSGATAGADASFSRGALCAGHEVIHLLGPRNTADEAVLREQPQCVYRVSDALLEGQVVSHAFERVLAQRCKPGTSYDSDRAAWRDVRRNFLQVCHADAVYVVAYRTEGQPGLDIGGGTGWACQFYLNRFSRAEPPTGACNLFFFDDGSNEAPGCLIDPATWRRWSRWSLGSQSWEPMAGRPPVPAGLSKYAGIGSSFLSEHGEDAIRLLFNSDSSHTSSSVPIGCA